MMNEKKLNVDLLTEIYKARLQFFSDHATRTWTRFNILLTMEVALLGWFFSNWLGKTASSLPLASSWLLPMLGASVSIIWYILGAQDRDAYQGFRERVLVVEKILIDVGTETPDLEGEPNSEKIQSEMPNLGLFYTAGTGKCDWLTWRMEKISLSRLFALFPMLFALFWLIILGLVGAWEYFAAIGGIYFILAVILTVFLLRHKRNRRS